ncbi:hypothetical protein, partial [Branchiibius sp. NY16-3462-2]|uniref:hypothetical protein n=1 Tax=Branchiibius sp. NY16-3462-2 TaxID=1807500 RepID=UPI0025BFBED0
MSALSMAAPPRIKSTKVDGSLASIALHHLGATFSQHRHDEDMGDIAAGIILVPVNGDYPKFGVSALMVSTALRWASGLRRRSRTRSVLASIAWSIVP